MLLSYYDVTTVLMAGGSMKCENVCADAASYKGKHEENGAEKENKQSLFQT